MVVTQRQMVQECFDGDRERNCSYCSAHYSKGGICCFGQKFEHEDPQCDGCPHSSACEPLTYSYETAQSRPMDRPRRIIQPGQRPPIVQPGRPAQPMQQNGRQLPAYGRRDGGLLAKPEFQAPPMQPLEATEELSFWQMMGVHAVWGAAEGMLEMLLSFFRRRRPD